MSEGAPAGTRVDGHGSGALLTQVERASQDACGPAIVSEDMGSLSYPDLLAGIDHLAGLLKETGIRRDDRIAMVLPDGPDVVLAFLAVVDVGVCCPLGPQLTEHEYELLFRDLRPVALIVGRGSPRHAIDCAKRMTIPILELTGPPGEPTSYTFNREGRVRHPGPPLFGDESLILQTSGTTGRGKLAALTSRQIVAAATASCRAYALLPADMVLNAMPMFHVHSLIGMVLPSLLCGAGVRCLPSFEPERVLRLLGEGAVTWFSGTPTMHQRLLKASAAYVPETSALRFVRSASAPLSPVTREGLQRLLKVPVVESYGMTEAHQIASARLDMSCPPGEMYPTGGEFAVLSSSGIIRTPGTVGEIVVRGATVMAGYRSPEDVDAAAFEVGWFRTGDLGFVTDNGALRVTGRIKDIINRGGEKISPGEIEEVLLRHPAVRTVAAFGVPDPELIESVAAAVVLESGTTVSADELRGFTRRSLAPYKIPARIVFLTELPLSPFGKVPRRELAALVVKKPVDSPAGRPRDDRAPTVLESVVAELWAGALGLESVGIHDDFVVLGGDSVFAVTLLAAVDDMFDVEISPTTLFDEASTVATMARLIADAREV